MVVNIVLIFLLIFDTQYDGQDGNTANLFFYFVAICTYSLSHTSSLLSMLAITK